jgi:hypothetical protein
MFNGNGYNLSDIAAVTRSAGGNNGDDMWGGNSAWWIILLFLFAGGWGNGNGWGGGGGAGNARDAVSYGFDMNGLENGIRGLEHGICDGFYEINTGLLTGFGNTNMAAMQNTNAIMGRLCDMSAAQSQCCCETQRLIERGLCEVNYNILTQSNATNTNISNAARDIIENNNNGVRSILDFLTQDKINSLQAENQALRLTASQQAQNSYLIDQLAAKAPVPAYVVANPNAVYNGYYGYNNGCFGTFNNNCCG